MQSTQPSSRRSARRLLGTVIRLGRFRNLTPFPWRITRLTLGAVALVAAGCAAMGLSLSSLDSGLPKSSTSILIEEGDTLARVFERAGLQDGDLLSVMEAAHGAAFRPSLVPGEEVRVIRGSDGGLDQLFVGGGRGESTVFVANEASQFTVTSHWREVPRTVRTADDEAGGPDARATLANASTSGAVSTLASAVAGRATNLDVAATSRSRGLRDAASPPPDPMQRIKVRNGDSLYLIFGRNRLPQADLLGLLASGENGKNLKRLRPGQSIAIRRGADGRVEQFHHEVDALTTVQFARLGDAFSSKVVTRDYDRHVVAKNGVIRSSLFAAAGGVPDKIIYQFVSVLGWDVDFARDLRRGDSFSILYEELRVDGRRVRTGELLALEFRSTRAGKPIRAFRYTNAKGTTDYFTPDGRSLRRAFMRNPVQFTRISSRFSKSRRHPVYRTWRAHRGVDYAAPRGTKVRATGDGQVAFAGRKGGYGKTIILSHGNGYSTLYAHLSNYAKKIGKGANVAQGDFIGRVGTTGVSTGPHLHYEFRINGKHQDPLAIKLPRTAPLARKERNQFQRVIKPYVARLETIGATRLASLDN